MYANGKSLTGEETRVCVIAISQGVDEWREEDKSSMVHMVITEPTLGVGH